MEYKNSRQNAKRVISSAKEKKQKEWANDLDDSECQNETFRMAKQMVIERQDITGLNCIKIQVGFTCLVPAYPGNTGKGVVKPVYVCMLFKYL